MAFLYRRDLELLGYEIIPQKIKKKRLLSVLAYADLYVDSQAIPCLATFFKFRNGIRIDIIYDENIENQIMNDYISFMRKSPSLLIEISVRNVIKIISSICGLMACIYITYILIARSYIISFEEPRKIFYMCICIIFVMLDRALLNSI